MLECCKVRVNIKLEECYKLYCCIDTFEVLITKFLFYLKTALLQVVLQKQIDPCASSFWYQLYSFVKSDKFSDIIKSHYELFFIILLKLINVFGDGLKKLLQKY